MRNRRKLQAFVHPTAMIGKNVKIWHFAYVGERSIIGDNTTVGALAHIDREIQIGRNCKIQGQVYVASKSRIGSRVFLGPACVLLNDKYPPSGGAWRGVVVEDGAVIGGNATIMPNVKIGRKAVVSAGALVDEDVRPEVVVVGSPARPWMTREEYDKKQREWIQKYGGEQT